MAGQKKAERKPRGRMQVTEEVAAQYGMKLEVEDSERTISPNEAAKVLDVTGEAVKQWIYNRRLPAVKLSNGYWRIKVGDLEKFIAQRHTITEVQVLVAGMDGKFEKQLSDVLVQIQAVPLIANNLADAMLKSADTYPALFIIEVGAWKDGWNLMEKIRSSRHIRNAPILLVSKNGLVDEDLERALDYNIQGCLNGNQDAEQLKNEISRVLAK